MSTLVVRNLPEHLHEKLKQRAAANHRSMTKEVLHLLESGLQNQATARPLLPPPLKLRSGRMLSIDDIEAAIADGQK